MARISEPGSARKPRKATPHSEAAAGGGYKLPPHRNLAVETDLHHPLAAPSLLAPSPRHVAQQRLDRSVARLDRTLHVPTPRQAAVTETHRAAKARRQQITSRARQDILSNFGLGPSRVPDFHDSGIHTVAPLSPGRELHDSGVHAQTGQSAQQISADLRAILRPGSKDVTGPIERLKAAGYVNPYGTTTHREGIQAEQDYRKALTKQIVAKQLAWQNANTSNLAAAPREIAARVKNLSTSELEKLTRWRPTAVQAAGLQIDPSSLTGLIHGTAQGVGLVAGAAGTEINKGLGLGKGGLPGRAAADLAQFPIAAVPALYDVGRSVGNSKVRKQVISGLSHGYVGSLIRGDHPSRYFHEHPLFSALEVAGGLTGVGRAIGAAGRTATRGALLSTQRAPLALADQAGTGLISHRSYSKDAFRQGIQRVIDKHLLKAGPVTKVAGREIKTNLPLAQAITDHHLRRIADYVASRATSRERVNRLEVARQVRKAAPVRNYSTHRVVQAIGEILDRSLQSQPFHGKRTLPKGFYRPERDLVSMALEQVIRSPKLFVADLKKERTRLETEFQAGNLDKLDSIANRERAKTIDRVLADPKAFGNGEGVFASARKLAPLFKDLEREAIRAGVLDAGKAARAKLFPTAMAHQGAKYTGALTHEGEVLPNQEIRAELARQGGDPSLLTYLPHNYALRGHKAYHQILGLQRKNFEGTHARTGAMFEHGASPYDYTHVLETAVGQSNKLVNIHEFDQLLKTSGIRHPDGRYLTADEARTWLRNGVDDKGHPLPPGLRAVRAFSSKVDKQALARIESQQGVIAGQPSKLLEEHFAARAVAEGDASKARNVVLIPEQIYSRLAQHIGGGRAAIPALQAAQSAFRRTVLPLSTKWLTGNVLEAVLRLGVAGVSPHDPLIGRKLIQLLTEKDAEIGRSLHAELIGGGLYGRRSLTVRHTGREVAGGVGQAIADAPVVHEMAQTVRAVTDVPFTFNRAFEQEAQYAALGKYARKQMQEMTGSWTKALRAQRQALDDVAQGLLDTPAQIAAAKYLDETLGKYNRFSPQLRNVIQTYAAFLPWYLNALRFTLHTLPAHHTLATALLAKTEATFQADYEAQRKALQDFPSLRTAVKTKGGGYVDLAHYTPFGFTGPVAAGDLSPIAGTILPQISGTQAALQGLNPFGQQLVVAKKYGGTGKPIQGGQRALIALNSLLESLVPGVTLARRLQEGGRTALPTSTVFSPKTKPATGHSQPALRRVFDPFRPVYLHPTKGGGRKRRRGPGGLAGSGGGAPLAGAGGGGRLAGG